MSFPSLAVWKPVNFSDTSGKIFPLPRLRHKVPPYKALRSFFSFFILLGVDFDQLKIIALFEIQFAFPDHRFFELGGMDIHGEILLRHRHGHGRDIAVAFFFERAFDLVERDRWILLRRDRADISFGNRAESELTAVWSIVVDQSLVLGILRCHIEKKFQ